MDSPLLEACMIAFASVFVVLTLLAVIQYLITLLFPEPEPTVDPVLAAVIASTVAAAYSGARVTRIEEVR